MLIATAGHIDHGKTALVRALTGVETDRLPEEQARGISIDLGYAYWRPEPGLLIGFVDVPGHERYIGNMLAGIGAVEFALLVVAANDGIKPQTREHARALELMGIARGAVVITKCDLVDEARVAEVVAEVRELLAASALAHAPLFAVSTVTGVGIADLGAFLTLAAPQVSAPDPKLCFRFAIDRAFSASGAGTVVTGTLLARAVAMGDPLVLSPAGIPTRVRGLQVAGEVLNQASAGQRCAINLAGIEVNAVRRGDWLVPETMHAPTERALIQLRLEADLPRPLRHNTRVHLHYGTASFGARLLLPGRAALEADEGAAAVLILDRPASMVNGERFVLRDQAGRMLLGGGQVLDPFPPRGRRADAARPALVAALARFDPAEALGDLLRLPDWVVTADWFRKAFNLTREAFAAICGACDAVAIGRDDPQLLSRTTLAALGTAIVGALVEHHGEHPESGGLTSRELAPLLPPLLRPATLAALIRQLADEDRVEFAGTLVRLPGRAPQFTAAEVTLWNAALAVWEQCGTRALSAAGLARELHTSEAAVRAMLYRRRLNGDLWAFDAARFMLREHVAQLGEIAAALANAHPQGFTAAQFRDASGLGRNFVIELLEFFDRIGITGRRGAVRVIKP